mmetsp:Transcript_47671/g.147551  ORF Transcript_47671/g.147551 Transcript_47671/m.147551 type:complete len:211 (-) Transcript_47671:101-733(-)
MSMGRRTALRPRATMASAASMSARTSWGTWSAGSEAPRPALTTSLRLLRLCRRPQCPATGRCRPSCWRAWTRWPSTTVAVSHCTAASSRNGCTTHIRASAPSHTARGRRGPSGPRSGRRRLARTRPPRRRRCSSTPRRHAAGRAPLEAKRGSARCGPWRKSSWTPRRTARRRPAWQRGASRARRAGPAWRGARCSGAWPSLRRWGPSRWP